MKKIYVVGGTSGEYSDRTEWLVDAWETRQAAEARVVELKTLLQKLGITTYFDEWSDEGKALIAKMRKEDPAFQYDYTGTDYYVSECDLKANIEKE